jgi:transmembrane sensor
MPPDPDFDPLLLDRVLAGDATEAERATVEEWALSDPAVALLLNSSAAWRAGEWQQTRQVAANQAEQRAADAWAKLAPMLGSAPPPRELTVGRTAAILPAHPMRSAVRTMLALAATLLLVVGAGGAWRAWGGAEVVHRGAAGTGTTVRLPDGSTVVLAPASRLVHPRRFASSARVVTLEGEAQFDVVHDAAQPFRVAARDALAEDIGTRFIVRAWPELAQVYVAVTEGIVALADTGALARGEQGTRLHAGETGRLAADGTVSIGVASAADDSWVRGELAFDNRPIGEVLPALSRWYAQPLRADSALSTQRVTAQLTGLTLREAIDAIALGLNAQVSTQGDTLVLLRGRP